MSPNGNIILLSEPKGLGKVIRTRRRALGLTQSRLASSAIVGRQWLGELEKGKTRAPLDLVIKVLGILGYALQLSDIGPPQAMLSPRLSPTGFKADRKGKGVAARQVGMTTVKHPLLTKGKGRKIQRPEDPPDGKALRGSYEVADLKAVGIALDRERLYDPEY